MLDDLATKIANIVKPQAINTNGKVGAYHGGYSLSGGGSDGSKFPGGISGSGGRIVFNHALLRRNGRIAYHQTSQAHSLVTRMADTIADVGLRWEPMPNAQTLGITPEEDFNQPLYELLEDKYKTQVNISREKIKARLASKITSKRLKIKPGEPVLIRERFVSGQGEKPVEYNVGYYIAEKFTYSIEIRR